MLDCIVDAPEIACAQQYHTYLLVKGLVAYKPWVGLGLGCGLRLDCRLRWPRVVSHHTGKYLGCSWKRLKHVLGSCLEVLGTTLKTGVVDNVLNVSGTQNMSCPIQLFKAIAPNNSFQHLPPA
jgi:hypothetical protein